MSTTRSVAEMWQDFKTTGDLDVKDDLVTIYAPLVTGVATGVRTGLPSSVDVADLVADGFVGLLDAIDKFEPQRGLAFQTYATIRIRGAIRDGLRTSDWVPRSVRDTVRALDTAVTDLEGRHRRSPTRAEIATELSFSPGELDKVYAAIRHAKLLSLDTVEAQNAPPLASAYGVPGADDDVPAGFFDAVHELPVRDRVVVALYYWDRLTQNEISQVMGVSESRVSQIRQHACDALRHKLSQTSPSIARGRAARRPATQAAAERERASARAG